MKDLNVYLADLWAANIRIHKYHWNVVGPNFIQIHNYTEELYDTLFEFADETAEYMRKRKELPVASIQEYAELTTIDAVEERQICHVGSITGCKEVFESLLESAKKLHEDSDDFLLANMLEDQMEEYEKQLWFMEATLVDVSKDKDKAKTIED